jgi:hypothetical protein
MADATISKFGQVNLAGDDRALFLKIFSGEVISSFEKNTVVLDKHNVRTITQGKSAAFPVLGRMPAAVYHTAGAEIVGQAVPHAERVLTVDKLLISHVFINDLDDAMNHYDVRGKYSEMMGNKLSQTFDGSVMQELILAARSAATITGQDGGFLVTNDLIKSATSDVRLQALIDAIYDCAVNFDNKFVTGTRYCILKPADYRFMAKAVMATTGFSVSNKDYSSGDFNKGILPEIAGVQLISSAMLPSTDLSGQAYHAVNASKTKAIVFTPDAVGTIKLMDISMQSEWDIRRQGELMVARYAMGHGVLSPECACEIATTT